MVIILEYLKLIIFLTLTCTFLESNTNYLNDKSYCNYLIYKKLNYISFVFLILTVLTLSLTLAVQFIKFIIKKKRSRSFALLRLLYNYVLTGNLAITLIFWPILYIKPELISEDLRIVEEYKLNFLRNFIIHVLPLLATLIQLLIEDVRINVVCDVIFSLLSTYGLFMWIKYTSKVNEELPYFVFINKSDGEMFVMMLIGCFFFIGVKYFIYHLRYGSKQKEENNYKY